jgi:hypothetical protein
MLVYESVFLTQGAFWVHFRALHAMLELPLTRHGEEVTSNDMTFKCSVTIHSLVQESLGI